MNNLLPANQITNLQEEKNLSERSGGELRSILCAFLLTPGCFSFVIITYGIQQLAAGSLLRVFISAKNTANTQQWMTTAQVNVAVNLHTSP